MIFEIVMMAKLSMQNDTVLELIIIWLVLLGITFLLMLLCAYWLDHEQSVREDQEYQEKWSRLMRRRMR